MNEPDYEVWMKKIMEEDFPNLNKNVIKFDLNPDGFHTYSIDSKLTIAPHDADAFNLSAPTYKFEPKNPKGCTSVSRYAIDVGITSFQEFRAKIVAAVLSNLEKLKEVTGKTPNDMVIGHAFLTFERPGSSKYFRLMESCPGKVEFRGFSKFITQYDKEKA